MEQIHPKSPRLVFRRAQTDDLAPLNEMMSDAETMRFWSTLPHTSVSETERWLSGMINAETSDEFILEYQGRAVGKLGAWRMPEIGFFLHRDLWGQGLASEALGAFMVYARTRGLKRLTADVDPLNDLCLRLLNRAGFQETGREEGTFTVGDRLCDSVYLEVDLTSTLAK